MAAPTRPVEPTYRVGERVRTNAGIGTIEFIAYSNAMESPVYTVAIDTRIKLRMLAREILGLED